MNSTLEELSVAQLKQAISIHEQIAALKEQLREVLGSPVSTTNGVKKAGKMSAAGRARIAAAQRARWAKLKGDAPKAAEKKTGRKMSAAARAAIAAAAKARWKKAKAAGRSRL